MKLEELVGSLKTVEMYLEYEKGTTSSHYNLALNTNYDASRMDRKKGINCRECRGYAATWSDEDLENN